MALDENINNSHLVELGDSDYEIVDGEPDIEGWDVTDDLGKKIGEVKDLLFDPESRKVRYMIVDIDDDILEADEVYADDDVVSSDYDEADELTGTEPEYKRELDEEDDDDDELLDDSDVEEYRTVLIPIGIAELVPDDEKVILPGVTVSQLSALPLYQKDVLTPATETSIRHIFENKPAGDESAAYFNRSDFYDHHHFNDDRFYNRESSTLNEPIHAGEIEGPIVMKEEYLLEEDNPTTTTTGQPDTGSFGNTGLHNTEENKNDLNRPL